MRVLAFDPKGNLIAGSDRAMRYPLDRAKATWR